jgi:thiamine-phosphate pyrophosphorylase
VRGYYFITDARLSRAGNEADVRSAVAAGIRVVQYREKCADTRAMYEEALRLRILCRGRLLIINDRVDLALAVNADGVHLGQQDLPLDIARSLLGPDKIIGITASSLDEALDAAHRGANYLGVSPIFSTATKGDAGEPGGLALLREIRRQVALPLVAIGGLTLTNAPEVIRAGADALCAISAVVTRPNVKMEIRKFQALFGQVQ